MKFRPFLCSILYIFLFSKIFLVINAKSNNYNELKKTNTQNAYNIILSKKVVNKFFHVHEDNNNELLLNYIFFKEYIINNKSLISQFFKYLQENLGTTNLPNEKNIKFIFFQCKENYYSIIFVQDNETITFYFSLKKNEVIFHSDKNIKIQIDYIKLKKFFKERIQLEIISNIKIDYMIPISSTNFTIKNRQNKNYYIKNERNLNIFMENREKIENNFSINTIISHKINKVNGNFIKNNSIFQNISKSKEQQQINEMFSQYQVHRYFFQSLSLMFQKKENTIQESIYNTFSNQQFKKFYLLKNYKKLRSVILSNIFSNVFFYLLFDNINILKKPYKLQRNIGQNDYLLLYILFATKPYDWNFIITKEIFTNILKLKKRLRTELLKYLIIKLFIYNQYNLINSINSLITHKRIYLSNNIYNIVLASSNFTQYCHIVKKKHIKKQKYYILNEIKAIHYVMYSQYDTNMIPKILNEISDDKMKVLLLKNILLRSNTVRSKIIINIELFLITKKDNYLKKIIFLFNKIREKNIESFRLLKNEIEKIYNKDLINKLLRINPIVFDENTIKFLNI